MDDQAAGESRPDMNMGMVNMVAAAAVDNFLAIKPEESCKVKCSNFGGAHNYLHPVGAQLFTSISVCLEWDG